MNSRTLLLACSWVGLCACLDDAPTFSPGGQRPPFVIAGQISPPVGAVYEGTIPFPINVPFRSEDTNIPLAAHLFQDLVPGTSQAGVQEEILRAGVYQEEREVRMVWTEPLEGCHSLTLILTYFDNVDQFGLPRDETLAARVVWWLNVADMDDTITLASCPGSSQSGL
ncbi:MAG: hypothetical protein RL033_4788 [Pseudomonadota bacterium]|jgi:hypothetical protein